MIATNIRGQNFCQDVCEKCGQRVVKINNKIYGVTVKCLECGKTYRVCPGAVFPMCHGQYMTEKEGD